jgi:TonB family protein
LKTFFLLLTLIFTFISSVQAASSCTAQAAAYEARLKRTLESICDNDDHDCLTGSTEAANIMKYESEWIWEKDEAEEAYVFGLSIQKLVREGDLWGLFALVDGELKNGPSRRFASFSSFHDLFSDGWIKSVLDDEPPCGASWRGYMLGPGHIWYHERDGKWQIFSINGAAEEETSKNKFPLGWTVSGKTIPPQCFVTGNWKTGNSSVSDFPWKPLEQCFEGSDDAAPITSIENGRVLSECEAGRRCGDDYTVIDSVSTKTCQELAPPNLSGSCISSYLLAAGNWSGGSIGWYVDYNIYGLFELDGKKKTLVVLKGFRTKNDALNYLDSIKSKSKTSECIDLLDEDGKSISITLHGFIAPKIAQHPARGEFTRKVLVLEEATCFDYREPLQGIPDVSASNVSHVGLSDLPEQLPDHGRPVTVTGVGWIGHTAWHLAPIMVSVDSIELLPENGSGSAAEQDTAKQKMKQLEQEAKRLMTAVKSKQSINQSNSSLEKTEQGKKILDTSDLIQRSREIIRLEAQIAKDYEAYQKGQRRKFVGHPKAGRFARYVEDWRVKVERIGNLNYPEAAKQKGLYGNLQITVGIMADGNLESIEINRSSGQKILDEAIISIVKLAGQNGFAPFPPDISRDTDILHITRTWMFTRSDELISK